MAQFTAQEITAAIFDSNTPPDTPGFLARLRGLFGSTAKVPLPRYLSLQEALHTLHAQGMSSHDVKLVSGFTRNFMNENLPLLMMLGSKDGFAFNTHIDWSHKHYLGVSLQSPKVDLAQNKTALGQIRTMYETQLRGGLQRSPEWFQKKNGKSAENSPAAPTA